MKFKTYDRKSHPSFKRVIWLGLWALTRAVPAYAATNVIIWDTGQKLGDTPDFQQRADWRAVPSETLSLEADPLKAASDPGYYGREYAFKGDAVVENHRLAAVFFSNQGRVMIYSKPLTTAGLNATLKGQSKV